MTWKFAASLAGAILCPIAASGQLSFETTRASVDAAFGQEEVTHDFVFTNTGDFPVKIRSISSSCGCTTADLEQRRYEPGESGKITGVFNVGQRVGEQTNTINVRTDASERSMHNLSFQVNIPRPLTLSHRFLIWQRDGEPDTRTVEATFHPDAPYHLEGVEVESDNFTVEVLEDENREGSYRLRVTPLKVSESDRAAIVLKTSPKPNNPRAFSFYAYVR